MEFVTDINVLGSRSDELDVRKENALMRDTILKLKDAIREHNLTGLSAPQIGVQKRILVINFNGKMVSYVNPMITNVKGFTLSRETCSSIPDKTYIRPRHNDILITFQTPLGKIESQRLIGAAAVIFQHHVDHLDGMLISDVGLEIDEEYDKATEDDRAKTIRAYLESLDIMEKSIKNEINEDEDAKKLNDAVDLLTSATKGEVDVVVNKIHVNKEEGESNGTN